MCDEFVDCVMGLTYQELFDKIEAVFDQKMDSKFQELYSEIRELKHMNDNLIQINNALIEQNKELRCSSMDEEIVDIADVNVITTSPINAVPVETKKHFNVLIISDSIYRHVGVECPKDNSVKSAIVSSFNIGQISVMKLVCPGARSDRLWAEAALLNIKFVYDHVVVHVGTNYVPNRFNYNPIPPLATSDEISHLLDEIGTLFQAKVSFSCILPRLDLPVVDSINFVNTRLYEHCSENGIGFIQCLAFKRIMGSLDGSLFAYDGVHLSRNGVSAMFNCFAEHVKYEHKWGTGVGDMVN